MKLTNGSRVAVIGGGPSGSFFTYFLLDMAEKIGINLQVDIYEPRDFSLQAPRGCNMCAGVISETLVQNLAIEGINIPPAVIQSAISSYTLHMDIGIQQIKTPEDEKRIAAIFRGGGPRGNRDSRICGFDEYLLSLAQKKGAKLVPLRVSGVTRTRDTFQVETHGTTTDGYDFIAVTTGVNTPILNMLKKGKSKYQPPKTTKTALLEYFIGKKTVEQKFGDSLQVFLPEIPELDFGMIVPKGDYVSVCILGQGIDNRAIEAFMTAPGVSELFPEGWRWDHPECQCFPRINVKAAAGPYADRIVFIDDSGVTRLYKDGIRAAYRAAKAAAACTLFEGISAVDFRRYYAPFCSAMEFDNRAGKFIFFMTRLIQRARFARKVILRMIAAEQQSTGKPLHMSGVLWDTFTGSQPYVDILRRIFQPVFFFEFARSFAKTILSSQDS